MAQAHDNGSPDTLPRALIDALQGAFLVFDGPDGSGKSTQHKRFGNAVASAGLELCEVREPGGTHVGERIREALLEHSDEEMSVRCEMMLYMASRAQLVEQRILPALGRGACVLADRFVSSTLAYQGTAGGLPMQQIHVVAAIACGGIRPDLVVIFDLDEHTAASRLSPLLDRMEAKGEAFHARVRGGYLAQAKADPERYVVIDASKEPDEVFESLVSTLAQRLPARKASK
ncbi:MAG: dTMP kinase [Planctomycetota bacterium]